MRLCTLLPFVAKYIRICAALGLLLPIHWLRFGRSPIGNLWLITFLHPLGYSRRPLMLIALLLRFLCLRCLRDTSATAL